ncbi:LysR family transcriptional regulator [Brucella pseudogrignonensis]|uniref:DNA-binding transcriptional LysR family regulator n=1 Tax=Brucella pseudogrignonensis TaxID=419475 RepID=A0ABU1MCX1_9HYPH|nr:LysR family transcriptional regulator [Brucella pseudogrignonensis]MDR6433884.1 DNA-binding transcriptional LysR family regulator [Brucella pseudogrignonensis]
MDQRSLKLQAVCNNDSEQHVDNVRRRGAGNIELRHLRYFLAIAEEMSFARAADRLNVAQPGLSQQIKILEELLEVRLFDRSRRKLRFTLAGELFFEDTRKILAQFEVATQTAKRAARGEVGRLVVGYVGSAAYTGMLTRVIGEFRKTHPSVELEISELEMLRQVDAIGDGRMDVGFIRPPAPLPTSIASIPILHEDLMIALPADHLLAERNEVALNDLKAEKFIIPDHPSQVSFNYYTTLACQAAGFEPEFGLKGRDFTTIASMVSVGLGVAVVPQSIQCVQLPSVVYRPIRDVSTRAELAVAFRRSDHSPIVRTFVSVARRYFQSPAND